MMKVTSNPDFIIPNNQIEYGQKLGEGGFGIVYKGIWNYVDVAVKKLMMELSESVMQEFEKEVEVHSKLRNPYIVQIFGITETYGMVMEYMSRGSLRNVLEKNRREEFPWTMRNKIAMDMLIGLSYLHQKKIIHRDLKSLNVLLDDQYKAKLADFGLAKVRSEISSHHSAQSGGAKGTTQWMAPEIFSSLNPEYTTKTDIFSYGIVLWELAAHEYPYKNANPNVVPVLVMQGLRETFPLGTPEGYAQLAQQCWDGTPDKRPTVDEAIRHLKAMDGGSSDASTLSSSSSSYLVNSNNQSTLSSSYMPNTNQSTSPSPYIPNTNQPIYTSPYMPNTNQSTPPSPYNSQPFQSKPLPKPLQKPPSNTNPSSQLQPTYESSASSTSQTIQSTAPLVQPTSALTHNTMPAMAFGKAKWERYFGDIGVEPPLPLNIEQILEAPCPFCQGKKVHETHLLTLIPAKVNNKPLKLKLIGKLVKKPLQGNPTKFSCLSIGEYKDPAAPVSHWALMSRGIIPDSRNKSLQKQQLVQNYVDYQVPTILDAVVSIFTEYVSTKTRLYHDNPATFTRCQEKYNKTWGLAVGGFGSNGLTVTDFYYANDRVGEGALRKFV